MEAPNAVRDRARPQQIDGRFASDLNLLECSSRYSVVRRVWYPIDPMRRFHRDFPQCLTPPRDSALGRVASLLEWAYGYRMERTPDRPWPTRRSPSAGALYPTECFNVSRAGGEAAIYYYDYREHGYYRLERPDVDSLADWLGVDGRSSAVVLSSVLWRSAQRYGARCYLYCLLDAGNVAGNLAAAARHYGVAVESTARSLTSSHERQLGLREGEGVMASFLIGDAGHGAVPMPDLPSEVPISHGRVLQPPMLSPVLTRIRRFHARTLSSRGTPLPVLGGHTTPDFAAVAERRHSASAFTSAPLDGELAAKMAFCCAGSFGVLEDGGIAGMRAWIVSVQGDLPPGSSAIRRDGSLGEPTRRFGSPDEAAARLAEACQDQAIVRGSAFAVVVGLDLQELASGGYERFRSAALGAGSVCSDLYRESARRGIGTTLVGGFSPKLIQRIVATTESLPLAVQLFGEERPAPRKVDAAIVGSDQPKEDQA